MHEFPPTPEAALARLEQVNPRDYAYTRNAIEGAVTALSPYITHGYLSVPDIARYMYHRHRLGVQHKLINELGWREYSNTCTRTWVKKASVSPYVAASCPMTPTAKRCLTMCALLAPACR